MSPLYSNTSECYKQNQTYGSGIIEIFEGCSVDLHRMVAAIIHGDDKVEEIAFPHVLWGLLLEPCGHKLMVWRLPVCGENGDR